MKGIKIALLVLFMGLNAAFAQGVKISGIVVDSIKLVGLSNVRIVHKKTGLEAMTDRSGKFSVTAAPFDTLVFSSIGFDALEYAVLFAEEDILIRLPESVIMLPEIVTIGAKIEKLKYAERREIKSPTPTLAEGIMSPFTYFSKTEKEKRKVIKVRKENNMIRTFVEVVNDPDLKKDMMNLFEIDASTYYTLLARFNQQNRYVQSLVDEEQIRALMTSFFKKELAKGPSE